MNNLFQTLLYQREKHRSTVLATIVWDDGSAPRGKGSQMLVGESGLLSGTIGGGAVELRAIQLAQSLLSGAAVPALHEFRLNTSGELGMVCGGDVTVLLTAAPLSDPLWDSLAAEVLRRVRDRVPGFLTLPLDGAAPRVTDDSETSDVCLSLPLPVGERALIFGAGHISRALVPLLRTVGFRPVVFDDRPGFAAPENFPQADDTLCGDFDRIGDYLTVTPEDYVVVMTNGHDHDFQVEVQLLQGSAAYVGVIGSRKKTAYVNRRLREAGITEEAIASVHTPIGTAIKAVTPEEIAVSITGEMICVRATRREAAGRCPMAAPCTDHLFLTGEKGVGKSTLIDHLLAGRTPCGFRTRRVEGVLSRPSVHLLTVPDTTPTADNLLFYCGAYSPERFDTLGVAALENRSGDVLLMDELGPAESGAEKFTAAVLAALDGELPVLGVLQQADTPFLRAVARHPRVRLVTVTPQNRDALRAALRL